MRRSRIVILLSGVMASPAAMASAKDLYPCPLSVPSEAQATPDGMAHANARRLEAPPCFNGPQAVMDRPPSEDGSGPQVPADRQPPVPGPLQANVVRSGNQTLHDLDDQLGQRGWNVPFFSYAGSLGQDYGGWRSTLAKAGIGLIYYDIGASSINLLGVPRHDPSGGQRYWGQIGSFYHTGNLALTYDLGRLGIPDGQFQFTYNTSYSTMVSYFPTGEAKLFRLAYYQSLFRKKVEFAVGYMSNTTTFAGTSVGGQLTNPFGPSSSITSELGSSGATATAPTAWIKGNFTKSFYTMAGVQRSISPTANPVYDDSIKNPSGWKFNEKGAKALYTYEIGLKKLAAEGRNFNWIRAGLLYNTSQYHNYRTGGTSTNMGAYALVDHQIAMLDGATPRRGFYLGASAMWAKPENNIITQYYEGRFYGFGVIPGRPDDMFSIVAQHNKISHYYYGPINQDPDPDAEPSRIGLTSITGSYQLAIIPGLSATLGISYVDHPSTRYFRDEGHAVNFLGGFALVI